MRIVFFIKRIPESGPINMQVFFDGVLAHIDSFDGYDGGYGGGWSEDKRAFIIPDIPKDAVEIKDRHLIIHEPQRSRVVIDYD